jgi:hypothetical protein
MGRVYGETKPVNVLTVSPSGGMYKTIQAAIDAACAPTKRGWALGCVYGVGVPADGEYVRITVYDAEYDVASDHILEFDTDSEATQTCPCGTNHLITDYAATVGYSLSYAIANAVLAIDTGAGEHATGCPLIIRDPATNPCFAVSVSGSHLRARPMLYHCDPEPDPYVISLAPGEYTGVIATSANCRISGSGKDVSIIIDEEGFPSVFENLNGYAVEMAVVHLHDDCALDNLTVRSGVDVDGDATAAVCLYGDRAIIEYCKLEAHGWSVFPRMYLRARANAGTIIRCSELGGLNPVWLEDITQCKVVDNVCLASSIGHRCHSFFDSNVALTDVYGATICNNSGIIERLGTSTIAGDPQYVIHISGSGNVIKNNTMRIIDSYTTAPGSTASDFIQIGGASLVEGRADMNPNIIADNIFVIESIRNGVPIDYSNLIGLQLVSAERHADVILSNNIMTTRGEVTALTAISGGPTDSGNYATIYILRGGLSGLELGALDVTNVNVVGWHSGSGAGVGIAALDVAFCAGDSTYRKWLVNWFRGKYINTTPDPNEVHTVWTDGTDWYLQDKSTVAT